MGDNTRPRAGDQPGSLEERQIQVAPGTWVDSEYRTTRESQPGWCFQRSLDDIRWQGQVTILRQQAARKQPQSEWRWDGGFDYRFELMGRQVRVCSVDFGQEWRGIERT